MAMPAWGMAANRHGAQPFINFNDQIEYIWQEAIAVESAGSGLP